METISETNQTSFVNKAFFLNFIYFTTITKQVLQLILIMLIGTDVCIRMVFVWEETQLSDLVTTSHADTEYQTRVAEVRGECVNTAPARKPIVHMLYLTSKLSKLKSTNYVCIYIRV